MQVNSFLQFIRIYQGETDLKFSDEIKDIVDVIFLCLGHGESKKFLEQNKIADS
jgi:N-acetyl-gamma-glutamyl-phosphate reductase